MIEPEYIAFLRPEIIPENNYTDKWNSRKNKNTNQFHRTYCQDIYYVNVCLFFLSHFYFSFLLVLLFVLITSHYFFSLCVQNYVLYMYFGAWRFTIYKKPQLMIEIQKKRTKRKSNIANGKLFHVCVSVCACEYWVRHVQTQIQRKRITWNSSKILYTHAQDLDYYMYVQ